MRKLLTTLALTAAALALAAGDASAQWGSYGGYRTYGSSYNYGYRTYSPYTGLGGAYYGSYGSQYYVPTYSYPAYSYPTYGYTYPRYVGYNPRVYSGYRGSNRRYR